jgi:PKD repeat protein
MSSVEQSIIMEALDAGWDVSAYGKWKGQNPAMDWAKQLTTPPALGRRGVILNGTPCVGLNYPQTLDFSETLPSCDRQMWWMVFDSLKQCDSTSYCYDITYLDLDGDGIKEDMQEHSTYTCNWIDNNTYLLMGSQWIYGDGGWKTLGLIIKTGDCYDTFWYHNYKYIADLNAGINILNPNEAGYPTYNPVNGEGFRLCSPTQAIVNASNTNQIGITSFKTYIDKYFGAPGAKKISIEDSFTLTKKDTLFRLCFKDSFVIDPFTGKKIYNWCFMYPDFTKGEKLDRNEINDFLKNYYFVKDTFVQLALTDTLFPKIPNAPNSGNIQPEYSLFEPGKYQLISSITNVYGCAGMAATKLFVGHYSDFNADDTIICSSTSGNEVTFQHFVRYFWLKIFPTDPDLNPNEYWVDPTNFLGLHNPTYGARTGIPVFPNVSEKAEWNFDDGSGWHAHNNLTDTIKWKFFNIGDYDISLRTTDSNGCVQILTKKAFIKVIRAVAKFDTSGGVDVCAPQAVDFLDQSFLLNNYTYDFDSAGNVLDSFKIDSVVKWGWDFGDSLWKSSRSNLQNPTHTYIVNGKYPVTLTAESTQGCKATATINNYVYIKGPQAKFTLIDSGKWVNYVEGCGLDYVVIKNLSQEANRYVFDLIPGYDTIYYPEDFDKDGKINHPIKYAGHYRLLFTAISDSIYSKVIQAYVRCSAIYGDTNINPHSPLFNVTNLPVKKVDFEGDTLICDGKITKYTDLSSSFLDKVIWDWGDNSAKATYNPGVITFHTYTTKSW